MEAVSGGRTAVANTVAGHRPRVAIAESSYAVREFLADALSAATQVELVAVCRDRIELESAIATWQPDVVLTDVHTPTSGESEEIRIASRLRETSPEVGVILLSDRAEPTCAVALLAGGMRGRAYLLKERIRNRRELIRAIEAVARGGSVIDPMVFDVLIQDQGRAAQARLSALTCRERELLAAIATGKDDAAIADSLFLTTPAVAEQVNSIFAKLHLADSEDVARRAAAILAFLSAPEGAGQR